MKDFSWCEMEPEDGDIVFLAEGLRSRGDFFSGPIRDGRGAFEAEEFTRCIACFDDPVGDKGQRIPWREAKTGITVGRIRRDAEGQTGVKLHLFTIAIRRKMARVCDGKDS